MVFIPEDIHNRSPSLRADAPREKTPPPSMSVAQRNACRSFTDSIVLWKLHNRRSSYSSTRLSTRTYRALPSSNRSTTRSTCIPISQRSNRRSILIRISLALRALSVLVKATWENTRGLSEFHLRSSTPRLSAARTIFNQRPTLHGGVEYQLADCADSRPQRLFQVSSSGTPPARCVQSLWCRNSP